MTCVDPHLPNDERQRQVIYIGLYESLADMPIDARRWVYDTVLPYDFKLERIQRRGRPEEESLERLGLKPLRIAQVKIPVMPLEDCIRALDELEDELAQVPDYVPSPETMERIGRVSNHLAKMKQSVPVGASRYYRQAIDFERDRCKRLLGINP